MGPSSDVAWASWEASEWAGRTPHEIEIAIEVIVKKAGLGTEAGMIQSVGFGTFRKTKIPVIDIKFIQTMTVIDPTRITDINIQPAIIIDIILS